MKKITCPDCGSEMQLKKSKFKNPYFYGCSRFPDCTNTHGAHPDGSPLGIPANKETREWRIKAHDAFDTLWNCPIINMTRKRAYKMLADEMGVDEVHIGEQDIEGCKRIIEYSNGLVRALRSHKL